MKKLLPPLTLILLITLGFFINRTDFKGVEFSFISIRYLEGDISLGVRDISLAILALISSIILIGGKYSNRFYISFWAVIGGIILKKYVMDIYLNIKSLLWLPEISISYLTVATGSMIIILSLIIESRSINE